MGILPMLSAEKTQKGRGPHIAERRRTQGSGETIRRGQNRSPHPLILSVAPVFGLCFSRHLCAVVILFLSASLPDPYPPLMTAPRPAALLLLRSLILAAGWSAGVASGLLGGVAVGQATPTGFSYIPGGNFTMGRTSEDTDPEAPPISVTLSPFYLQQTETTKAQWDEVRTWGLSNGYTDLAAGAGKAANHPVQTVSWWDVVKWCNARSEKEGLTPVYTLGGNVMRTGKTEPTANWSADGYRLPTEAEWEKAARGGVSGKRFPWGTETISHAQANYRASSQYPYDQSPINDYHPSHATGGFPYTSPVGTFGTNGFGLYDLAGNVNEWCWDWYEESSYLYLASNGTTDPRGILFGLQRVSRGGSWGQGSHACRVASRSEYYDPSTANFYFGFRPARSFVPSVEAVPKPDLSIGSGPTAGTGVGVYPPTAQSIAILSRRGAPVTLSAKVANEGLLPDAMRLRGSGGNSLFAVSYKTDEANVTAQVIAGTFATPELGPDDPAVGLTVTVTPNRRLLTKTVKNGNRIRTAYLRKTYTGLIEATAARDTNRSDTVRYQITNPFILEILIDREPTHPTGPRKRMKREARG